MLYTFVMWDWHQQPDDIIWDFAAAQGAAILTLTTLPCETVL